MVNFCFLLGTFLDSSWRKTVGPAYISNKLIVIPERFRLLPAWMSVDKTDEETKIY